MKRNSDKTIINDSIFKIFTLTLVKAGETLFLLLVPKSIVYTATESVLSLKKIPHKDELIQYTLIPWLDE